MARAAHLDMSSTIARANRTDDATRDAGSLAPPRSIPLDLAPLLAPHKKHGRLSLRIERLPQKSRLSAGSRNNDGSWSLATDELEDLIYQLAPGFDAEHSLGIRIVSLAHGSTLAVLDYVVAAADAGGGQSAAPIAAEDTRADTQVQTLRAELAKLKTALAARDAELIDVRRNSEQAVSAPAEQNSEAALIAARTAWKIELEERLAGLAAQAEAQLQLCREEWQTEQEARFAEAEADWKAGETARLAAAEADWREAFTDALAKANADAGAMRDRTFATERRELHEKIAAFQATLDTRDAALAHASEAAERAQRELQESHSKAEQAWLADEAARFAAAEAQWQTHLAKTLAEARAQATAPEDRSNQIELRDLQEKSAALQAKLVERDAALARALREGKQATQDAIAVAQQAWKTDEAARLADAEAQWQATSAKDLAQADAAADGTQTDDAERQALRENITALQAAIAERDAELGEAQEEIAEARHRWERGAQNPLARGGRDEQAGDAAWLAAAEAEWRKKHSGSLAEATARYEAAEGALAQIRIRAKDDGRVHQELAATRVALATRESELADMRLKLGLPGETGEIDADDAAADAPVPEQPPPPYSRAFIASVIAAACLFAAMIVFYPSVEALIFGAPAMRAQSAPQPNTVPPPDPVVVEQHIATLTRDAKLRAAPSLAAKVVATLPHGASVSVVELRGKWTLVRAGGEPGKAEPAQGWVTQSLLKDAPVGDAKPTASKTN